MERERFGNITKRQEAKIFLDKRAQALWTSMLQHPTGVQLWDEQQLRSYGAQAADLGVTVKTEGVRTIEQNTLRVCELLPRYYRRFAGLGPEQLRDRFWTDGKFQNMQLSDPALFADYLNLDSSQQAKLEEYANVYHLSSNPHYLSLMDPDDPHDPIRQIFVPFDRGIPTDLTNQIIDPSGESEASNIGDHTRQRYPLEEVAYVNMPAVCPAGCGYCQRARGVLDPESLAGSANPATRKELEIFSSATNKTVVNQIVEEVAERKYLTDVLLSGGDAFMLPPKQLIGLLDKLFELPQFQRGGTIRLGSKVPVVNPWRCMDEELLEGIDRITKKYPNQLYVVTHIVHPREITPPVREAVASLKRAGISRVLNQAVLLSGINDHIDEATQFPGVLGHTLLASAQSGIDNYYVFLPKEAAFSDPYSTGLKKALDIAQALQNNLPGPYLPQDFVVSAPANGGKIRVAPNWISRIEGGYAILQTTDKQEYKYPL